MAIQNVHYRGFTLPPQVTRAPERSAPKRNGGDGFTPGHSDDQAQQQEQLKRMRQLPTNASQMAAGPRMQKEFQELRSYGDTVMAQLSGKWSGPLQPGQHRPKDGLEAMHMVMSKAAGLAHNSRDFSLLLKAAFVPNSQLVFSHGVPKSQLMPKEAQQAIDLPSTGFAKDWKDTTAGVTNDGDQTHHLTAYILTGYIYGEQAGSAGSLFHKADQGRLDNTGDINLGNLGSRYGERLRRCENSQQLQEWTDNLCDTLRKPATGLVFQ